MLTTKTSIRVRYGETDQMGYVYYGHYALYFEVGRVEMLRSVGLTYKSMEDKGVLMPVMNMETTYHRPARYDDLLTITTEVREMPDKDIIFHYAITNESGLLINSGLVRLCFVSKENGKRMRCPEFLNQSMAPYFA